MTATKPCEDAGTGASPGMVGESVTDRTKLAFGATHLRRESLRCALRPSPPDLSAIASSLRPAAVLVPVVERDEPTLLFTRRSEHLPTHAGQISFPGGRLHEEDASLTATALRETEEEIGIGPDAVEIAGFLDAHETLNSGFMILPVVGFLRPGTVFVPNDKEVAEVFEAPLSFVIDPRNHTLRRLAHGGAVREFHAIAFNGRSIWGATAAIIVNLSERLRR